MPDAQDLLREWQDAMQSIVTAARSQSVERRSTTIRPSTSCGADTVTVSSTPSTVSKAACGRSVSHASPPPGRSVARRPSSETSST